MDEVEISSDPCCFLFLVLDGAVLIVWLDSFCQSMKHITRF